MSGILNKSIAMGLMASGLLMASSNERIQTKSSAEPSDPVDDKKYLSRQAKRKAQRDARKKNRS